MINHEKLRQSFKPDKIKVLFIAESPPPGDTFFYSAKSGFYIYTKKAFYNVYNNNPNNQDEFLSFFRAKGCFLDDISHKPSNFKEICSNKEIFVKQLSERINLYNPNAIIITLIRIDKLVRQAIGLSRVSKTLNEYLIFTLPFPGNGFQNKYVSGLESALHILISKNILS